MASYLSVLIQAAEPANYKLNYDEHYMISVPLATTTTPGVTSFDSDYFKVENGVVSLSDEYVGELNNIIDRLDEVEGNITDLENGKVNKIVPESYGTYVYAVRTDIIDGVINYIFPIASVASANTIVVRNANGRIKIANGVNSDEAVTLSQLTTATTNIQESALSVAVRTKLNKAISRVGITHADWQALPDADKDINTMYFVGPYGTAPNQYFVEWMYFVDTNDQGHWEALGSTLAVDLSDYFTKSEINALLAGKANVDGVYSGMSVGHADIADQINTDREIEDAETACPPTVFGTVGGNAEVQSGLMRFHELRGHTIKWNQHARELTSTYWYSAGGTGTISDGVATFTASAQYGALRMESAYRHIPVATGHKFLLFADVKLTTATDKIKLALNWNEGAGEASISVSSSTSWQRVAGIVTNSGQSYNDGFVQVFDARTADWDAVQVKNICCFDLTEIYGAGKEPTTAAEVVRDFPLPYYAYNAGTLLSSKSSSVDFIKRNQWDEDWEVGKINWDGSNMGSSDNIRSKNYIRVLGGETYYVKIAGARMEVFYYDANKTFISYENSSVANQTITVPTTACFLRFYAQQAYGTTYNHDICIYVNWETPGLPYVPYSKQHITLPNIKLQSVGDVYDVAYQTGGGKRRIGERAYQSGDENDPDVLTDGTTTLYVLTIETDITTTENPGWTEYAEIDNFGTVKFNQSPAQDIPVPQAYFVRYTVNLVEFLDSLYVHCGGDVSKIALTS